MKRMEVYTELFHSSQQFGRQVITQSWKEDLAFRKKSAFVTQSSYQEHYCLKLPTAQASIQLKSQSASTWD